MEIFEHPIPCIDKILRILMKYKFFSEADMDSGYHQFRISKNLQDIFTFTCSKGKVSMDVLPFGIYWAAGIFQHSMCDIFLELLTICLQIYIDNLNIFSDTYTHFYTHASKSKNIRLEYSCGFLFPPWLANNFSDSTE